MLCSPVFCFDLVPPYDVKRIRPLGRVCCLPLFLSFSMVAILLFSRLPYGGEHWTAPHGNGTYIVFIRTLSPKTVCNKVFGRTLEVSLHPERSGRIQDTPYLLYSIFI